MKVASTLPIGAALAWTSLDGAMTSIPSGDTEASPVLTLAVQLAPGDDDDDDDVDDDDDDDDGDDDEDEDEGDTEAGPVLTLAM